MDTGRFGPRKTAPRMVRGATGRVWPRVPSVDEIDRFFGMIDAALATIPSPFAEQLGSVAIAVEDEPTPEQLASVGAFGLYGLYQGVPRTRYRADEAAVASKITLFRGPLERRYRGGEALAAGVADTLIHEIAHHFGIDDERIRDLQRAARTRR